MRIFLFEAQYFVFWDLKKYICCCWKKFFRADFSPFPSFAKNQKDAFLSEGAPMVKLKFYF